MATIANRRCEVKTTRPKPARTCRLSAGTGGSRRILTLYQGARADMYWLEDQGDGRFTLEKWADGTIYSVGPEECGCPGHRRWGYRTTCKHRAAIAALAAAGRV